MADMANERVLISSNKMFPCLTVMSMVKPPTREINHMTPPPPEGAKNVASAMLVEKYTIKSVAVAMYLRRTQVPKKKQRNPTKAAKPTNPVSPRTMSGRTPFSMGAE